VLSFYTAQVFSALGVNDPRNFEKNPLIDDRVSEILCFAQMRSHVNSRWFLLRKAIDNLLCELLPRTWVPLYTMVIQQTAIVTSSSKILNRDWLISSHVTGNN